MDHPEYDSPCYYLNTTQKEGGDKEMLMMVGKEYIRKLHFRKVSTSTVKVRKTPVENVKKHREELWTNI